MNERYDIAIARFPFTNMQNSKIRPVLVIAPLPGTNTIVCQISSKKRHVANYRIDLEPDDCDSCLHYNSYIYPDVMFTLDETQIIKRIGTITNRKIQDQTKQVLREILQL